MRRILLILALVGLTCTAGCRICADPYLECGPTYVGECGNVRCDPLARAGSVLSPPLYTNAAPCSGEGMIEGDLEPIPTQEEVIQSSEIEASSVMPLPRPPRSARAKGPTFLR